MGIGFQQVKDVVGMVMLLGVILWIAIGLLTVLALLCVYPPKGFFNKWSSAWRWDFVGAMFFCVIAGPVATAAFFQTLCSRAPCGPKVTIVHATHDENGVLKEGK